jgi:peptidoglycan glycosyltransferase
MDRRIRWLGIVLMLCFVVLFLQLNNIQVLKASSYANAPGNPRNTLQRYDLPRGTIESAGGQVLAESVPTHHGLYKYQRVYPTGSLFAQVVGFTSYIYGLSGVEAAYNKYLIAHTRPVKTLSDLLLSNRTETDTVTLTLSEKLQALAQKELAGRDGAVVVLNPRTGAIMAMYANPSFNPNPLASQDAKTERLAALADNTPDSEGFPPLLTLFDQRGFPPGSTFKMVTSSAIYQRDPQLANKVIPYYTEIPLPDTNQTLHNYAYESCGGDLAALLPPSCDTGFALLGLALGAPNLVAQADAFGFNKVPPLDIPGAVASAFPPVSSFAHNLPFLAYSAIGQGNISATPLQMALVASAIANHGVIMTPHVMANIRDSQGQLVKAYEPKPWLTPISASTASSVAKLMRTVVTHPNGTAYGLFPPSLDAAAKTGTAQTGTHHTDDWLAAFAPYRDPKAVVVVMVPDQSPNATGNSVAGPIISVMLQAAVDGVQSVQGGQG